MKPNSWIGPPDYYDYMGAVQFCNLFMLGFRHFNTLLDYGCGSLRFGRFAIQYLDAGNYYGIEPKGGLIGEGIKMNHLEELIKAKEPHLRISGDCDLFAFNKQFDYIIAQSVFTHMPLEQIDRSLKSALEAMHHRSIFLVNYHPGQKDYEGKEWTQKIITYRPETLLGLIEHNHFVASPVHLVVTHLQSWLMLRI